MLSKRIWLEKKAKSDLVGRLRKNNLIGKPATAFFGRKMLPFAHKDFIYLKKRGYTLMNMFLSGSVGRNGKNNYRDVKKFQVLLNGQYFNNGSHFKNMPLKVNGPCGSETIAAIEYFQNRVFHISKPNLRVDPYSPTF
jgi:hypothetical protein